MIFLKRLHAILQSEWLVLGIKDTKDIILQQ